MAALLDLSEEEAALFAILSDDTGIELAEFEFIEHGSADNVYRLYDFQWDLNGRRDMYQVTCGSRNVGKSYGIQMRVAIFPWCHPGQHMLLTAPELNHLRPLTNAVEDRLKSTWLLRQMLPTGSKSDGFTRAPHWEAQFVNGAKVISRLPQKTGLGVKGMHVLMIEQDEAQDYGAGWAEVPETLNRGTPGARWRVHGVPRGVRDRFYDITQGVGDWVVHRPMAMMRPSWCKAERDEKIKMYGGSRQSNDYRRNLLGEHGDSSNALFVLARLIACVDMNDGSTYNSDVYKRISMDFEALEGESPLIKLDFPIEHRRGWDQAPKGYSSYHGGADVGVTIHPSEVLIFGQRAGTSKEHLDLLLRVNMQRIALIDQEAVIHRIFEWYGEKLVTFGVDSTGVGADLAQRLELAFPGRATGYHFSSKQVVGVEDRELNYGETEEDLEVMRDIITYSSDLLREIVDAKEMTLPNDNELLQEFQGQTYIIVRSSSDPYGKRSWSSSGSFHTLDAAKMAVAARKLMPLHAFLGLHEDSDPILDLFVGA